MSYLDRKFIGLLSSRVDRFKKKSETLFNIRCPYCGDSKKKKSKARGYIYAKAGEYFYICHNCGVGRVFRNFLKDKFVDLYTVYRRESYESWRQQQVSERVLPPPAEIVVERVIPTLPRLAILSDNHPARVFCDKRKMPVAYYEKLMFTPTFFSWANTILPKKFKVGHDEPRIIIPFQDGFQGRSLSSSSLAKYINVVVNEHEPHFFGLDEMDPSYPVYVFEGPFDAMFIPNSIATGGGDIIRELDKLTITPIICYDNEKRNRQTIDKMLKAVDRGYRVCVWPETIKEKDVNEMILAGKQSVYVKQIIDGSVYSGASAKARIKAWSRVEFK